SARERLVELFAQLPQRAVDATLYGALPLAEHARDVAQLEVGAKAQGQRLALVLAEQRKRPLQLVPALHRAQRRVYLLLGRPGAHVLQSTIFVRAAASVIAQQVQRDRVEPAPLASL